MKITLPIGAWAALAAYGMWGSFPLVFRLLDAVEPATIVAARILWSVLFVGAGLALFRQFDDVRKVVKDNRALKGILSAALLLSANWLLYVWAVNNERVLETSFGYFINPLVSVGLGLLLLKERLTRLQAAAIALAVVAVAIQAIGIGGLPWISLALAFSFGFYGYFRKTVAVGSATGLFLEVVMLAPLALLYLLFNYAAHGAGPQYDIGTQGLLALIGPLTALPLLCFAFAAKRLALTSMGMFQYLAPTLQFLIAVFIFHEPMNKTQLVSFILIWLSLALFTVSSLRKSASVPPVGQG